MHRLLIIEDETGIRESLVDYFTGKGFAVTEAASAEEALALFRDEPFPLASNLNFRAGESRAVAIVVGVDGGNVISGQMWNGTSWSALSLNPMGSASSTGCSRAWVRPTTTCPRETRMPSRGGRSSTWAQSRSCQARMRKS